MLNILYKQLKNGKAKVELWCVVIDLGAAVLRIKREIEWMLKLRTLYPYGLNEKLDIYEDDKNLKRFKSNVIVGKLFPSLPRLFQSNQACFCHTKVKPFTFTYSAFLLMK